MIPVPSSSNFFFVYAIYKKIFSVLEAQARDFLSYYGSATGCGSASKLRPWPYYTYHIDSSCKSASSGGPLSAPIEGHPESSISSNNQQFEPPQVVAQAWTPIHSTAA